MIEQIETKEDYEAALLRIEVLMDIDPALDTTEGEELNKLASIIEAYEAEQGWGFEGENNDQPTIRR